VAAHGELEALCLDRDLLHFKQHVALKYAELVYFAMVYALREAIDAFVDTTQRNLTGSVALSLLKACQHRSRKSDYSLYRTDLSSSPWAQAMIRRMRKASFAFWDCLLVAAPKRKAFMLKTR